MKAIPANYITPEALKALVKVVEEKHPDLTLETELLTACGCMYEGRDENEDEDENPCSHVAVAIARGKQTFIGSWHAGLTPISEDELRSVLAEAGLTFDLEAEEMDDETDDDDYNHDVGEYGTDAPYYYYESEERRFLSIVFALVEPTHNIG